MNALNLNTPLRRNKSQQLNRRVFKGAAWVLFGGGAGRILTALCSIVLARILGPEDFGKFGIVRSTVMVLAVYGAFRMGNTATKYVAQYRSSEPEKAARVLRLALYVSALLLGIVAGGLALFSEAVAEALLNAPELALSLKLAACYLFITTCGATVQQALGGFENFKAVSAVSVLSGVLTLGFCIPLGYVWGVNGAFVGLTLSGLAALVLSSLLVKKECRRFSFPKNLSLAEIFSEARVLWIFAVPSFLIVALMTGTGWLGRLVLVRQIDFAELGRFEAAGQWVLPIYFIPSMLARVAMPILSANEHHDFTHDYSHVFGLQLRTVILIAAPVTILLIGLGELLVLPYGERYAGIVQLMPYVLVAGFMGTLNEALRVVYESKARQWTGLLSYGVWAAIFVAVCASLVPTQGARGLATATIAAEFGLLLVSGAQVQFRLAPGVLTRHVRLFLQMFFMVALAFYLRVSLPSIQATVFSIILAGIAFFPLFRLLQHSRVAGDHFRKWTGKLARAIRVS